MVINGINYIWKERKLKLISNFLACVGLMWTAIEFLSYFISTFRHYTENNLSLFLVVAIVSLIYSSVTTFPKTKVSQEFKNLNTSVNVEVGDLLEKKGNIIIASSDYFDTKTSQTDSLKSQVISRFFNNAIDHLDICINMSLKRQKILGEEVRDLKKSRGKTLRYEPGTTVDVDLPSDPSTKLFISVICRVVYNGETKVKNSDFRILSKSLEEIWKHIKNTDNNKDIYAPILGSGVTGLSLSKSTLVQLVVFSYLLNSKESKIGKSLNIIVPKNNYDPKLFEEIQIFLRSFQI